MAVLYLVEIAFSGHAHTASVASRVWIGAGLCAFIVSCPLKPFVFWDVEHTSLALDTSRPTFVGMLSTHRVQRQAFAYFLTDLSTFQSMGTNMDRTHARASAQNTDVC